jgi:hypothetical protein
MIPPLSFGFAGGSAGPAIGEIGDFTAGLTNAFSFNNAFSVGGSGKLAQDGGAEAKADGAPVGTGATNQTQTLLIGAGLLALGILVVMTRK